MEVRAAEAAGAESHAINDAVAARLADLEASHGRLLAEVTASRTVEERIIATVTQLEGQLASMGQRVEARLAGIETAVDALTAASSEAKVDLAAVRVETQTLASHVDTLQGDIRIVAEGKHARAFVCAFVHL